MTEQRKTGAAPKLAVGIAIVLLIGITSHFAWTQLYQIPKLRKVVAETMRDPDSVQFKDESKLSDPLRVCGFVNAKNAMGGYTGFARYIATAAGSFAVEGEPVTGWVGYKETDRLTAMVDAQLLQMEIARAHRDALDRIDNLPAVRRDELKRAVQIEIPTTEAYRLADLKKFVELWGSQCVGH